MYNSLRAEAGDSMADLTFREGEAIVPKCLSRGVICQVKWTTVQAGRQIYEPDNKVLHIISQF